MLVRQAANFAIGTGIHNLLRNAASIDTRESAISPRRLWFRHMQHVCALNKSKDTSMELQIRDWGEVAWVLILIYLWYGADITVIADCRQLISGSCEAQASMKPPRTKPVLLDWLRFEITRSESALGVDQPAFSFYRLWASEGNHCGRLAWSSVRYHNTLAPNIDIDSDTRGYQFTKTVLCMYRQ